jgi:guanylate kinase
MNATGMLAVNSYDEFLKLVEVISKSYLFNVDKLIQPGIVILVGPSGSGKSKIAKTLLDDKPCLAKLKT